MSTPSSADLLAAFSDDTDVAQWINGLLDAAPPPDARRADVAELATRLEVACQDTASQLESAIDDISRTVPRLAYDLHFLRESALALRRALAALQARIAAAAADADTAHALQRLRYLDTVKTRMEAARDVLREAESWSTLEPEVSALLAEPHYERAAERLADASRSMVVFHNTPEYDARRALMVSLQNQLEAALSAALVAAINARDAAACKSYYAIFAHIQREPEFRNYYNGSRRAAVVQLWAAAALADVDGEAPQHPADAPVKFSALLARFFAAFLALVHEERIYAPSIFPDPQQTLSVFVQSTIDALTPSLSQRLSGLSEHYGAAALPEIIRAFRAAEEFAVETDKALEKVGYASLYSPQVPAPPADDGFKSHSRRLSKRMSLSRRLGPRSSISIGTFSGGGPWEQALFEPFIDFQAEYQALETKHLDHALAAVVDASRRAARQTDADGARAFRERAVDVFSLAEEALARCIDFTHGYGAVGLLRALDHVFASFLDASRAELLAAGRAAPASAEGVPGDTFEELDYSAADWHAIQLALHLLDACRGVRERLGVLETQVRTTLVQVASAFRLARGDPQNLYIPNTTRGEALLLSQSPLNSAELQGLLDRLEPAFGAHDADAAPLLAGARAATVQFARACQGALQDTLLAPLLHHLAAYAAAPAWAAAADGGRAGHEPGIPTFSLSPTPTIQRVAEGLLNLPRLFEVYAADDALAFSVETLPFVDAASLRAALAPSPAPSPQARSPVDTHVRHLSVSYFPPPPAAPPPPPRTLPPETIVAAWLSSLALSLLAHLTAAVLPAVRALSARGAAQLASDLAYLSNVVRALNVEWAELEQWREAVELPDGVGRRRAADADAGAEDVFRAVAKIRGWL